MCKAWGSCWDTKVTKVATIPSLKMNGPTKVQPCAGRLEWVGVGVLYPDAQSIARATGSQLEAEVSGPPTCAAGAVAVLRPPGGALIFFGTSGSGACVGHLELKLPLPSLLPAAAGLRSPVFLTWGL